MREYEKPRLLSVTAAHVAALEAENAKLRKQSERLFDKTLELASENSKLRELCKLCEREAENAKLRKLAADLLKGFECGWPSDVCGDCERDAEGMPTHGCPLRNQARELGIEVPDE